MKKYTLMFVVTIIFSAITSLSYAGQRSSFPVTITPLGFYGSFGSARNSDNDNEFLFYIDYGSNIRIFAQDAAGNVATCSTDNPVHLALIRGAVDSSLFFVSFGVTSAGCASIIHVNGSILEPKQL